MSITQLALLSLVTRWFVKHFVHISSSHDPLFHEKQAIINNQVCTLGFIRFVGINNCVYTFGRIPSFVAVPTFNAPATHGDYLLLSFVVNFLFS